MTESDLPSQLTRTFYNTLQRLKAMQISMYEKAVDLSDALDDLVSDSFGSSPKSRLRRLSGTDPDAAAIADFAYSENEDGDDATDSYLMSKLERVKKMYDIVSPKTGLLILLFGCTVIVLYVVAIYFKRRLRHRNQYVFDETTKLRLHTNVTNMRFPMGPVGYPIPFRPQYDAHNILHKRTTITASSRVADTPEINTNAAAGDIGSIDDKDQPMSNDHQHSNAIHEAEGIPIDHVEGRKIKNTVLHSYARNSHTSKRMTNTTATSNLAMNPSTLRHRNSLASNLTGSNKSRSERVTHILDLSIPSGKLKESTFKHPAISPGSSMQTGASYFRTQTSTRRACNTTAFGVSRRDFSTRIANDITLKQNKQQEKQDSIGKAVPQLRRPWRIRPQKPQQPAPLPLPPPSFQNVGIPVSNVSRQQTLQKSTVTTATASRYEDIMNTAVHGSSSASTCRARSVSPSYNNQQSSLKWTGSPVKSQTQKPWHAFQIQSQIGHIPTVKPKTLKQEIVEPNSVTRWAGGLPRQRICEIRQKVKQTEAPTTEKTTKIHISPIEKQRSPMRTKPTITLSTVTPKRNRDTTTSFRRKDGMTSSPTTKHTDMENKVKKAVGHDLRRRKGSSTVISDGRPRFKTDWSALFTSISARNSKRKKTKSKKCKKKQQKPALKTEELTDLFRSKTPECFTSLPHRPKPILPIKPQVSPLKVPFNFSGEMFELRKTLTPILSSLSGQGAFTSYVRESRCPQNSRILQNEQSSTTWTSDNFAPSCPNMPPSATESGIGNAPVLSNAGLELPTMINVDAHKDKARHNTKFLSNSTSEQNYSSQDASVVNNDLMNAHKIGLWTKPSQFVGDGQQPIKSHLSNEYEAHTTLPDPLKSRHIIDGSEMDLKCVFGRHVLLGEVSRENNNAQQTCFNSNLFNSTHANNKTCNITLSQESNSRGINKLLSVNLQKPNQDVVSKTKIKTDFKQDTVKHVLRNASPLQFEMPMQEPLLSDIVQTFNPKSKALGSMCRKKSGMGAYLEVASKLNSSKKIKQPHMNSPKDSANAKHFLAPTIKRETSNSARGSTVFRITRNRVTTLNTQQGRWSKAKVESRGQTRKELFQQQRRLFRENDSSTNQNRQFHNHKNQPNMSASCHLNNTTSQLKLNVEQSYKNRHFDNRLNEKGPLWQLPTENVSPNDGSVLDEKTGRGNKSERNYSQEPVISSDHCIEGSTHHVTNRSNGHPSSYNKQDKVQQVQEEERKALNCSISSQYLQEQSSSKTSVITFASNEETNCSGTYSTPTYNSSKIAIWGKSRKAIKSRSLISVTDILTKLGNSVILKNGGYSPSSRRENRISTMKGSNNKGLTASQRKSIYQHQKSFHDKLGRLRNKRQCRKGFSKENLIPTKFISNNTLDNSSISREGSFKGNRVCFYKMKKKTKPLRHEPYQIDSLTRNHNFASLNKSHKIYQARNRNNCSPLRKGHIDTFTPLLGKLSHSPSCDSVSISADCRLRQTQESLNETDQCSEILGSKHYEMTIDNRSDDVPELSKYDKSCLSTMPYLPMITTRSASGPPCDYYLSGDKTNQIADLPKGNISGDNRIQQTQNSVSVEKCRQPSSKSVAREELSKETLVEPSLSLSVRNTKSHTTQTDSIILTSQNIAIQTSPKLQRSQARHKCHSSKFLQQLIRQRSQEIRLERSKRHASRHITRTRTHPLTAHWVFQQNNQNVKNDAVHTKYTMENPFTKDATKVFDSIDIKRNVFMETHPTSRCTDNNTESHLNETYNHIHETVAENQTERVGYNIQDMPRCTVTLQSNYTKKEIDTSVNECISNSIDIHKRKDPPTTQEEETFTRSSLTRQDSGLSKLSEMCLVRPSWKNVNIEEVDRRVKRALRLRKELQKSRSSLGSRENGVLYSDDPNNRSPKSYLKHNNEKTDNTSSHVTPRIQNQPIIKEDTCNNESTMSEITLNTQERLISRIEPKHVDFDPRYPFYLKCTEAVLPNSITRESTNVSRPNIVRENSFGNTEKSMSLQDFPIAKSSPESGPERPLSARATSCFETQTESNYLKRSILSSRTKNSPPTKISKVENQTFPSDTPRLVGALVQRLPHVPLSSFVEWFIETSDPKNFVTSERSKTASGNKSSSDSKSTSGDEKSLIDGSDHTASNSNALKDVHSSSKDKRNPAKPPKLTIDRLFVPNETNVTEMQHRNTLKHDQNNSLRDVDTMQSSTSGIESNYDWKCDRHPTKTKLGYHRPNISATNLSHQSKTTASIRQTSASLERRYQDKSLFKIGQQNDIDSTSIEVRETSPKNSHTYRCENDTPTAERILERNKKNHTAQWSSTSAKDVDNSDSSDLFDKRRRRESYIKPHVNCSVKEQSQQEESCKSAIFDEELCENRHAQNDQTKKPLTGSIQILDVNDPLTGERKISLSDKLMKTAVCSSNKDNSESADQTCAPGIRNILMRLQKSEDDASPQVFNQPERVRITLRRSSDVSGIIAKFQDQTNKVE